MAPMRRKSHGSIRSPHVKRDSKSQVVIEGWLFKLEGGALKQWKQRWCVLADFCLFFYKGPHEEKITSSILLPSYKVNPCSTEDKISRKFAFKAEHQNMKTYYFAAEDKESMKRWMNAMSLASIMQKFVKSDHYDATFSSTSNDDEDSGFTSYRSKRFPNQNRANSSHDSSFRSEPLKHRSNSYGDRMGEVYLSSDDKYPNMYKSSPSHLYKMPNPREPPVRQPLYANAPPKPKRMASSDSFGMYPNDCYDPRDREFAMEASQYQMYHADPDRGMRYDPDGGHESSMKYHPETDRQGHERTTKYFSDNEPEEISDPYRNQPPRPRSADFLERDPDCSVIPSSNRYQENPQPPRPKSSLECYNRYMDSEEGDFDDYREAVRMQADQLYANKNLDKSRRAYGFRHPDPNATMSDQRLNIHYVGNSQFDEQSSYTTKDCDLVEYRQEMNALYGEKYDKMVDDSPTNKVRKESMQRLLEWKQRMLQSPLSRKNQIRSNSSSDTSSPMNSPMKYQQQSAHSYRGRKELNNRNASFHKSGTTGRDDYVYSSEDQMISGYDSEQYNSYRKPYKPQTPAGAQYNDHIADNPQTHNSVPNDRSNSNSTLPENSANNLYKQNVMYCVDSENNEILFSYDDNSPADCNVSSTVQSSHYPPMMHSFSTMPNVSDIGNESQNQSAYDGGNSLTRTSRNRNGREDFHNSPKVLSRQETTTYSSDDEDIDEKKNRGMQERQDADACEEVVPNRYQSSSPDYVNIGAMSQDYLNDDCEEMFSSQISYKDSVNQAVLKPLKQVSKSLYPEPDERDSNITQSVNTRHSSDSVASDSKHRKVSVHSDSPKSKIVNDSFDSFDDEMEFGIRREDYYRASQIFYSSTRGKNKTVNPQKKESSSTVYPTDVKQTPNKNYNKDKTLHLLNLDKDIGLPICDKTATKNRMQNPKPKETFELGEVTNDFRNKEEMEKTPEDLVRLKPLFNQVMTELTESVSEKDPADGYVVKHEAKKNLSYEEMRGQLLRKREAPPPNIVQDRIKKFETVETVQKNSKAKKPVNEKSSKSSSNTCYVKEKYVNRASVKRNHYKASRSRNSKRILHSDSEAVVIENTDESSDDLTMKSAPILLSPFSSVLADLRKTADSGKDNESSIDQIVPITSMKEYFCAFNEPCLKTSVSDATLSKTKDSSMGDVCKSYSTPSSSFKIADEVEYLPMSGLKEVEEPEYVMMNGNKFLPNSAPESHSKVTVEDEHVYNEPFSPPPSFLHDVYEKQKMKQFQYEMKSSSSEESLTENIYEKPMQKYASAKSLKSEYSMKSVQETNSVLMSSLSCSNVTSVGQPQQGSESSSFRPSSSSRNKVHHYEQTHLSVSVPDLLQLQEMKDSDASDADDEASRDFDTTGSAPLPSYQTSILHHFYNEQTKQDLHSSFDSEIVSYTQEELSHSTQLHCNQQYNIMSPNPVLLKKDANLPRVKPLPSYETLSNVNSGVDSSFMSPNLELSSQETENNSPDNEKKIHVRKLRVYTKGKKPEAPKIFPVPFNVEESELNRITERKDGKHSRYENVNPISGVLASVPLVVPDQNNCLSENVAYLSRAEASSYSSMNPPNVLPNSFAPDVVPTVQVHDHVPSEKLSSPSSKSPNSAPYYYSDLFGDFKFANDMPYFDKVSPPRNNPALLNNVRSASPYACKGDVGRKVNKINTMSEGDNNRAAMNDMTPGKQWRGEATKRNLKCALDMFQCSESKYLDAEKNKYEAGHTLEKTRSNSTMSYFKQRSSTPDLNSCHYQSDEPVYENIIFQPKEKLQRRLSQSLEGIPNAIDKAIEVDGRSSPVYENIEFFHQLEASYCVESASKSESITRVSERGSCERQIANSCGSHLFPEKQFCDPVVPESQQRSQYDRTRAIESDRDFLDQSVLRRVSAQHFFGQNSKQQSIPTEKTTVTNNCGSIGVSNSNNVLGRNSVEENLYDQIKDPSKSSEYICAQRNRFIDSDSTSLATSSCDEASVDSDGRYRMVATRMKSLGISGSISDSDSIVRESNHLRKLVQQSEGLMCKGKRLSVSAGDLLGKTHEELVLLLIQLRRNQAKILKAKEKLVHQLDNEHRKPQTIHQGLSQNYRELQRQIQQLETQYDITKPLVTLVDNMVKLGSLYGNSNRRSFSLPLLDSSQDQQPSNAEVSPSMEQSSTGTSILSKLLTGENNLQKHIAEIYSFDEDLRHETDCILSLIQDKKGSQNKEAELSEIQNMLDELANHRHRINNNFEKCKCDARSSIPKGAEVRASPTGVAGSAPLPLRKKHHSTYLETDLDTMTSRDLAVAHERDMEDIPVYVNAEEINIPNENVSKEDVPSGTVPSSLVGSKDSVQYSMQDINEADDRMKRFYGILPKEKPCEIKTVRIVKRQSEKRSRERDKKRVTYDDQSSVWVVEEPDVSSDDLLDVDEVVRKATVVPSTRPTSINLLSSNSNRSSNPQSAHERLFGSGSKKEKPVIQQERSYSNKKSKRRHYTVSGYQYMLDPQFAQYFRERPRSRDDVDMERCLRTANTPDIVRSTIKKNDVYDDKIIERELMLPQKIEIPERYVEVEPERLSASEKLRRSQKAENICKMLSETTTSTYEDVVEERSKSPEAFHKKLSEEKRKRAHLLSLNRALAREVVERSKAVAANIYSPDNQAEP
ncbi:uncharacterized protein LOC129223325 [Uloborus diversus]|uniref:uncharacterized protein LOC129223325 n=1 Tax=Uloborus diversus TaxID=327109 RepID=UPI002409720D|nr:uncharacterized protein LOC129223325 [Uloborus diversus]